MEQVWAATYELGVGEFPGLVLPVIGRRDLNGGRRRKDVDKQGESRATNSPDWWLGSRTYSTDARNPKTAVIKWIYEYKIQMRRALREKKLTLSLQRRSIRDSGNICKSTIKDVPLFVHVIHLANLRLLVMLSGHHQWIFISTEQ